MPQADVAVRRSGIIRRYFSNPVSAVAMVIFLVIVAMSLLAPFIAPYGPLQSSLADVNNPWSAAHVFGGDASGRDVLSELIWGGRSSLLAALIAIAVSVVIGVPSGLVAGFYGGRLDTVGRWLADIFIALPAIVALLATISAFGPAIGPSMIVLGVLFSPTFFRLTRASVMAVRNNLYIDAAVVSGLSDRRILSRHVLGVVRSPIIIQSAIMAGIAIGVQAGLEFLGLGDPNVASWGAMLNSAFRQIYIAPGQIFLPGLAITITIASLALIGSGLRDALTVEPAFTRRVRKSRSAIEVTPESPAEATSALLKVTDLKIGYPGTTRELNSVVHGVSFEVNRGEVLGLVGESGSGKSQTVFAVMDLLPAGGHVMGGRIDFDGRTLTGGSKARKNLMGSGIGYIPQEPMSNLDPSFTIGSQLITPLLTHGGLTRKQARVRAVELLERVGIADAQSVMKRYPHEISGGMAQRVLIAGAVSLKPLLLIADEPTTALDVTVQAEVLELLRGLQAETGLAILLVTHNFGVVADLCDRVAVMSQGNLVEQGDVRQILHHPSHPYTRGLLDATIGEDEIRPPFRASVTS